MEFPFLSVITINLNNCDGLERTVLSVINQSYTNFEYLIIDGGSIDNSLLVINKYKTDKIHYISEKDNGIYNAMNKAIRLAKGKYILFLNSGDEYYSVHSLEVAVVSILNTKKEVPIYFFDYMLVSEAGKEIVSLCNITNKYKIFNKGFGHPSTIYNANIFDSIGLFDENFKIAADRDFYMNLLVKHKLSFSYYSISLSIFYEGGISTNPQYTELLKLEDSIIREKYYSSFENKIFKSKNFERIYRYKILSNFLIFLLKLNLNRF
jgi:glycosyltransferase involved in cell wall biosynthesis